MQAYDYHATDRQGAEQRGQIDAANIDEARGRLLERGWTIQRLAPVSAVDSPWPQLSANEAEELAQHMARLAQSSFPLGAGFRAAAEECENPRVAQALRRVADRTEQGQSLASILQGSGSWLPPHVAGLILAALRTGRLGEALLELVDHQRAVHSLRQGLWQAFAYPITVLVLAMILLGFIVMWLSSAFQVIFRDFGMQVPVATRQLFWWRDTGIWILVSLGICAVLAVLIYRKRSGPEGWTRLTESIPLIGPLIHFRGIAEWSGLMSVLVKNKVPLPDALRWSAEGVQNAWVAHRSRAWAEEVARGQSVSELLASRRDFPSGILPLIQWGESNSLLAESFATCREVLERRVRVRADMLRMVLPPVLFLVVGCWVAMILVGLFMPLVALIQGLS